MSSTVDISLQAKVKKKSMRDEKNRLFADKNAGDFSGDTSTTVSTTSRRSGSSTSGMSEANILPRGPRLSATSAIGKNRKLLEDGWATAAVTDPTEVDEPEWDLPVRAKCRLRQRPDHFDPASTKKSICSC
jgi:hypothetical protein